MKNFLHAIKARCTGRNPAMLDPLPVAAPDSVGKQEQADFGHQQNDSGERTIVTRIGGKVYQVTSDDKYLEHVGTEFEPGMVALFDSLLNDSDHVFDVGANIGCTSLLFGQRAAQVSSFEPSPTTFKFLQRNIHAAGLGNVVPVNVGLGKTDERSELTFSVDNRSGGFVSNRTTASAGHEVEAIEIVRGDRYVREQGITRLDFVKIDVEGFEKDVIEGMREAILQFKPVVVLELNHWCLNAFQRISVPDFLDFLRSIFPYLYAVDNDGVKNLHNADDAYHVMYWHIVGGFKYPNLVGAFDRRQLRRFSEIHGLH